MEVSGKTEIGSSQGSKVWSEGHLLDFHIRLSPDHSLPLPWQSPGRGLASACILQILLAGVAGQVGGPGLDCLLD